MTGLQTSDIEKIYEELAQAIDRAGPVNEALFLAKLALALASRLSSADVFSDCVAMALQDLPSPPQQEAPPGRPEGA